MRERNQGLAAPPLSLGAFTRIELLVVVSVVILLALLAIPAFSRARARAARVRCTSNLMQLGSSVKTWALDHFDKLPPQVAAETSNVSENSGTQELCRYFRVLSNELSTPFILICPADKRKPAKDFGAGFCNTNISYFFSISAVDDQPQTLLSGDRNLTNGAPASGGVLVLTTNHVVGWTAELHNQNGNVLLCDGSIQQVPSSKLNGAICGTNRLAMP